MRRAAVRTKRQLDAFGITLDHINVQADAEAADGAETIPGRTNIPLDVDPDGSLLVEPSTADVESKLLDLSDPAPALNTARHLTRYGQRAASNPQKTRRGGPFPQLSRISSIPSLDGNDSLFHQRSPMI